MDLPAQPGARAARDFDDHAISRRDALQRAAAVVAALAIPAPLVAASRSPALRSSALRSPDPDHERLRAWTAAVRTEGRRTMGDACGPDAIRVGEMAAGSPYVPGTLDAYLEAGGSPNATEPLTLSLTRFDCVTLVESCLAVARVAEHSDAATWAGFGREVERMRYRGGERRGYVSRLHYFSEWISDGARRGLVRDWGAELGGMEDARPLRFMTAHRASYPALANDVVLRKLEAIERRLDANPRHVVPAARVAQVVDRIENGDVLAFATSTPGLDVTHSAFAHRGGDGVLRVLHAPLSGGVVEVTRATLPEYVAAIRRCTGILVARPLRA
ncbi:MAG TPA: N-acetylmuramoyl-L-alanine amidase-like domain-containing protein [Gemmatimonadales bacterium]|nr:N-acetylmuramoyl-L-alanine amidase-like domain-containing protein [Gemmatimonadales bacterium]